MTISQQEFGRAGLPDLSSMTEEEQIAYAMQMSLQGAEFGQAESGDIDASSAMDTSEPVKDRDRRWQGPDTDSRKLSEATREHPSNCRVGTESVAGEPVREASVRQAEA